MTCQKKATPKAPRKAPRTSPTDKQRDNLKPAWKPGESGNPDGLKPGTVQLRTILKSKLAESLPGDDRRSLAERLIDSTVDAAISGDSQARKLVWEYCEGKASQTIDMTTHSDQEVEPQPEMSREELYEYARELHAELREHLSKRGGDRYFEFLESELSALDAEYHDFLMAYGIVATPGLPTFAEKAKWTTPRPLRGDTPAIKAKDARHLL